MSLTSVVQSPRRTWLGRCARLVGGAVLAAGLTVGGAGLASAVEVNPQAASNAQVTSIKRIEANPWSVVTPKSEVTPQVEVNPQVKAATAKGRIEANPW